MPDISVIIPVFNRPRPIRDAVESVFRQTLRPREIIVVDDGSVPSLESDLKAYIPRIKYIYQKENRGVSAARNAGVSESRGRYIAFLDSDDLFLAGKLERQWAFMREGGFSISHTGEFWYRKDRFVNQGKRHAGFGGRIFPHILDRCRVSPSTLMMARELFDEAGGFDESLRVCEDYELSLRLALRYEIGYLPQKLIIKRAVTDNSLSASIKHIESIRLGILERFVDSHALEGADLECAHRELARKKKIVKTPFRRTPE